MGDTLQVASHRRHGQTTLPQDGPCFRDNNSWIAACSDTSHEQTYFEDATNAQTASAPTRVRRPVPAGVTASFNETL
jgi:hypothetical protein